MTRPVILADENIPFAREAFGTLGEVRLKHGRQIAHADLADVDLLVVRSITKVDAALVAGTRVQFVGTATSGSDHVDTADLERLGIAFHAALGCNANAVSEYMAAAWLTLARLRGETLAGRRVGVIGVGHVGSLVVKKARALGMEPVLNDPPKARETGRASYRPLEELLDCITPENKDLISEKMVSLRKERDKLKQELGNTAEIDEKAVTSSKTVGRLLDLAREFRSLWKAATLSERKEFLSLLIDSVSIHPERKMAEIRMTYNYAQTKDLANRENGEFFLLDGRGEWIRTTGLLNPIQTR